MSEPDPNAESEPPPGDDRSAELDGLRIRQLATLRRAAYRSRSHAIIALLVCAVAVVHTSILLAQHLRYFGWGWRPPVYIAVILAAMYGVTFFWRRAVALHREAKQSHLETPTTPPDFSTLSDGSQRWKNLEDLSREE